MSEFTGWGRTNRIDFGDYVRYPYGMSKEMHIWKVVSSFQSNTYIKPPYMFNKNPKIQNGGIVPVLNIIHCGIDETKVITVRESDCVLLSVKEANFVLCFIEKERPEVFGSSSWHPFMPTIHTTIN